MLFGDRTPAHIVHQNQLDYGTMLSLALAKQLRISHVHVQTASLTLLRDYNSLPQTLASTWRSPETLATPMTRGERYRGQTHIGEPICITATSSFWSLL